MEDIQEDLHEFVEDHVPVGEKEFLDDSFGTNLEFSRLIQNHG